MASSQHQQQQQSNADTVAHKSLEEMLNSDVDESAISAIVGSLENSFAASAAVSSSSSSVPSSITSLQTSVAGSVNTNNNHHHNLTNNTNNNHHHQLHHHHAVNSQAMSNNIQQQQQVPTSHHSNVVYSNNNNNGPSSANIGPGGQNINSMMMFTSTNNSLTTTSNSNTTSINNSHQQPGPEMGKRILLSANSQSVNTSVSNMSQSLKAQQQQQLQQHQQQQASSLSNGTMTPPPSQSPSLMQTSLQHQQTIPVGQQVALVASQIATSPSIRPCSTPTVPLSAISSSPQHQQQQQQLMLGPNSKMSTVAQKSNPTYFIQSKDGQPMLIGHPGSMQGNIRPNVHFSGPATSMQNSIAVSQANFQLSGSPGGLVLGPRPQQHQQILQSGPNGSNIQLQFVNVNSPSRQTMTMSPSSTGVATMSNMMAGTNSMVHGTKGQTMQPRIIQFPHNARLSPQVRPNNNTNYAPLNIPNLVRTGTFFLKTENGQVHVVNVGPQAMAGGQQQQQPPTLRLQVPQGAQSIPSSLSSGQTGGLGATTIRNQMAPNQIMLPVSMSGTAPNQQQQQQHHQQQQQVNHHQAQIQQQTQQQQQQQHQNKPLNQTSLSSHGPLTVQTSSANSQSAASAPSQMSPSTAKKKCNNFLSTLIRLASDQPDNVASNVKSLIQGLIDDTIQPEEFTNQLQKELSSSPQPCLVPFLKKSLPYLRYSLMKEELKIDGVRPPPVSALSMPSNIAPQTLAQLQHSLNTSMTGPLRGSTMGPAVRLMAPPPGQQQLGPNIITQSGGIHGGTQQHVLTTLPGRNSTNLQPIVLSSVNSSSMAPTILSSNVSSPGINTSMTNLPQKSIPYSHRIPPLPPLSQSQPSPQLSPNVGGGRNAQQQQQHNNLTNHNQHHLPTCVNATPTPETTTTTKPTPTKSKSTKSKGKSKAVLKSEAAAAAAAAAAALLPSTAPSTSASSSTTPLAASSSASGAGERTTSSFRDDDDINDVAAMGGVNLQEESQRILAGNAEIIGQQIRSCNDENFLYTTPLHSKINKIVKRFELDDCPHEVVSLISHAVQERLKTLVEKLGGIAEHRQEQLKNKPEYEVIQDVKAQVQFLQELDRIEKRRHEEQEREVLIKAAKSRSKVDDPDHIAIKARAKEMQRQELEEIRQREANETALQAIGFPKKRLKTSQQPGSTPGNSNNNPNSSSVNNASGNSTNVPSPGSLNLFGSNYVSKPIKRIKRVTMKDVYFLMEHEKDTIRSPMLFKTYAR